MTIGPLEKKLQGGGGKITPPALNSPHEEGLRTLSESESE